MSILILSQFVRPHQPAMISGSKYFVHGGVLINWWRPSSSENTLNAALRRFGYDKNQMTAHGFRGMASARLNDMGRWNPDAIERQLAHQEANDVRRAYMHAAEYWPERVEMMQAWADYLDELRDAGKVIPLRSENA
jgi:integrase